MHTLLITIFVATYVSIKLIAYTIVLPSLPKYKNKLSVTGKSHYDSVVDNRRWKGLLSIILGLLVGIWIFSLDHNENSKLQMWGNIIFVTFWSMFVFYNIMWQDRFLFEENNLDDMIDADGKLSKEYVDDLKIYADKYKDMHLAENIINIVTFVICIIVTTSFYFYLKNN